MSKPDRILLTGSEVAKICRVTRGAICHRVRRKTLRPIATTLRGHPLFDASQITIGANRVAAVVTYQSND